MIGQIILGILGAIGIFILKKALDTANDNAIVINKIRSTQLVIKQDIEKEFSSAISVLDLRQRIFENEINHVNKQLQEIKEALK